MPYSSNSDLPASVRHALPEHAQDIYRAAFNSAWEEHGGADEARLFRIAWGAVSVNTRRSAANGSARTRPIGRMRRARRGLRFP